MAAFWLPQCLSQVRVVCVYYGNLKYANKLKRFTEASVSVHLLIVFSIRKYMYISHIVYLMSCLCSHRDFQELPLHSHWVYFRGISEQKVATGAIDLSLFLHANCTKGIERRRDKKKEQLTRFILVLTFWRESLLDYQPDTCCGLEFSAAWPAWVTRHFSVFYMKIGLKRQPSLYAKSILEKCSFFKPDPRNISARIFD